jgi:hypothetical protein
MASKKGTKKLKKAKALQHTKPLTGGKHFDKATIVVR